MNRVLDRFLCERFPELYADRNGSMRQTAMCWGFSCGDGWFQLLFDLSEEITAILKRMDEASGFPEGTKTTREVRTPSREMVRATQVKEKFGTLRFYTTYTTDEISEAIRKAEARSAKTCMECGDPGVLRGKHYVHIACGNPKCNRGDLPVGCEYPKTKCSQGTAGCGVDHEAEDAEEESEDVTRIREAADKLRKPTAKDLDPESV
jgi:hypothetical protein